MALIADGGGAATRPQTQQPVWLGYGPSPWRAAEVAWILAGRPGVVVPQVPQVAAQPSLAAPQIPQVAAQPSIPVTINVGQQGYAPPGGGGEPAQVVPPAAAPALNPWDLFQPLREPMAGPPHAPQLTLRPQDWLSIPAEVRGEVTRWLWGQGWRPSGQWGRYGPSLWMLASPPRERAGTYEPRWFEESAFTGLPDNIRAWIWWLFSQKGWAPAAERPATTAGWTW